MEVPRRAPARRLPPPPVRLRWDRIAVLLTLLALALATGVHAAFAGRPANPAARTVPVRSAVPAPITTCHPRSELIETAPAVPAAAAARTVALTFDDGPSPWTRGVLDLLRARGVTATFFVIGRQAVADPQTVRDTFAAGNAVGNHTWSHPEVSPAIGWRAGRLAAELTRTGDAVRTITGSRACLFRPPGGVVKGSRQVAARLGLSVVLWSVDTRDWAEDRDGGPGAAARIVAAAEKGLSQPHPVILLHDGGGDRSATLAALGPIVDAYRAHGYRFVRLAA